MIIQTPCAANFNLVNAQCMLEAHNHGEKMVNLERRLGKDAF